MHKISKLKYITFALIFIFIINIGQPAYASVIDEINNEDSFDIEEFQWDYRVDLNFDCKIDQQDIDIVTYSYGATPSDVNWDEDCDINCDKVIDIVDIVLVARSFGLSINEFEDIPPAEIVDRMEPSTQLLFLNILESDPELMACYKSINSNNLSTIDDKYSEIQEFNSSQATNVMSFSFGFYQIYELNKELCAIGLSPMLRYGIMASATSCMSSILEGTLPVGKICAVVTGLGLLALFIFYWDEIQEKSDEILAAFKKVFYQVASMIETYYYNFLHFIETKKHVNSNGDEVERDLVEDEDELLEEANKAAGGDLDDCDFDGEDHWTTKDKQIKIEWAPGGHKNTNEGPHVTVYENVSSTKKPVWKVIRKIFIKGWENYRKSYY